MKLWLDDVRAPWDYGAKDYWWARTVPQAIYMISNLNLIGEEWEDASLDHDLGACKDCLEGMSPEEWLSANDYRSMPNCEHFGTGYTFVRWMIENNIFPNKKPRVHSMNPVGRKRMEQDIDKAWRDLHGTD